MKTEFKTVYIEDGLVELNEDNCNYENVYEIKEIIMPNSVRSIKNIAFAFNGNLKKVVLSENLEIIPRHFLRGSSNLEEVNIPKCCSIISENAFYSCLKLKKIKFPNCLRKIEESAFSFCSLEEIEIPESLNYIYRYSFDHLPSLKKIKVSPNWSPTIISDKMFGFTEDKDVSPFANILKKLGTIKFIDFLKSINEDENNVFKYLEKGIFHISDVRFLLGEEDYKGLKEGIEYGI